jgi:hypothetical protein
MSQNESLELRSAFGYSSEVQLFLEVGERSYRLAQIAPESVMLREPADLPPSEAEVVMRINGRERRWPVFLTHGAALSDLDIATVDR